MMMGGRLEGEFRMLLMAVAAVISACWRWGSWMRAVGERVIFSDFRRRSIWGRTSWRSVSRRSFATSVRWSLGIAVWPSELRVCRE